jgi:hypothetical protein
MRFIKLFETFENKTYTMYSGTTMEAYDNFFKNKNLKDKLTNVTSSKSFASDYSYNFKTGKYEDLVLVISNIPLDAFIAYRNKNYRNDDDFIDMGHLSISKKEKIIETKELFLVDLYKYKDQIELNLIKY